MTTEKRTKSYLSQLDKRELLLVNYLLDTTFEGTKEDAAIKAGYARGKTVYDKLRSPKIQGALLELHDKIQAELLVTNLAKRQKIMDRLFTVATDNKTAPVDVSRCSETWGKFDGAIGSGTNIYNNLIQNAGGRDEETLPDRLEDIHERREKVLSKN
jgi:hypothetical protein